MSGAAEASTPRHGGPLGGARAYLAACALVLATFALLEAVQPFYFFQDDNRDIFLPLYLHNYRALADGQLAQYNFFQSLGRPHLASGQTATLHPIPYLAIFLSNVLFDHPFAGVDLYVLLYLLIGALGMVKLARSNGWSDTSALFAVAAWSFIPFNMHTSQSWTTYPPVIGLLPWLVDGTLALQRGRSRRGAAIFTIAHLALFYVGAPQFFIYGALIDAALIVALTLLELRAGARQRNELAPMFWRFLRPTILTTGLCLPLVLPMWQQMQQSAFRQTAMSWERLSACNFTIPQIGNGLLLPMEQLFEPYGWQWCERDFPTSFPHQGYAVTGLAVAWWWLRKRETPERRRVVDALLITGLLFAAGAAGMLQPIIRFTPLLNRFRWPFKYWGFGNFFFVVAAAAAFDVVARDRRWPRWGGALLVAAQLVNVVTLDVAFPRPGFFEHLDAVPLNEPLRHRLANARTISLGCTYERLRLPTIATLGYDYATYWELDYFGGYDPLVPLRNFRATLELDYRATLCSPPEGVPIDYLRSWGVRYYIINKPYGAAYEPVLIRRGLRRVHSDSLRVLLEDPQAPPLAGSASCTNARIGRDGDDLVARVTCSAPGTLVLRYLYQPNFIASVDGAVVDAQMNDRGQTLVPVGAGSHVVRLAYDDPLFAIGKSLALLVVGGALAFVVIKRRRGAAADEDEGEAAEERHG